MKHELRENLVTWYKLPFAVCRKRDPKSLYSLRDQLVCGVRNPFTRKKAKWRPQLSGSFVGGYRWRNCGQGDPVQQKQTPQPVNEVSKIRRFRCFTCSASGIETRFSSKFTVFKPSDGKHLIFLCGSGSHANFEKLYVAAGMYVKGHTEFVSARGEHFDCPGRVARRIFELYTAV